MEIYVFLFEISWLIQKLRLGRTLKVLIVPIFNTSYGHFKSFAVKALDAQDFFAIQLHSSGAAPHRPWLIFYSGISLQRDSLLYEVCRASGRPSTWFPLGTRIADHLNYKIRILGPLFFCVFDLRFRASGLTGILFLFRNDPHLRFSALPSHQLGIKQGHQVDPPLAP